MFIWTQTHQTQECAVPNLQYRIRLNRISKKCRGRGQWRWRPRFQAPREGNSPRTCACMYTNELYMYVYMYKVQSTFYPIITRALCHGHRTQIHTRTSESAGRKLTYTFHLSPLPPSHFTFSPYWRLFTLCPRESQEAMKQCFTLETELH